MNDSKNLLSIGDASEYLNISIDTLRRWEKKGRVDAYRSPGGHRYFKKNDLDDLFGKKYTRDEETQRSSKEEEKKDRDEIDIKIPKITVSVPNEQTESKTENEQKELNGQVLDRPVREVKIPDQKPIEVINRQTSPQTMSPQEAYYAQQKQSILTPPSLTQSQQQNLKQTPVTPVQTPRPTAPTPGQTTTQSPVPQQPKKESTMELIKQNKYWILATAVTVVIAILAILLWQSSRQPLSPIPR